jgi:hypothetical protein
MSLSDDERRRVLNMLDRMEGAEARRVLSSYESFSRWLENVLYAIYCKIRNAIKGLWDKLCSIFS